MNKSKITIKRSSKKMVSKKGRYGGAVNTIVALPIPLFLHTSTHLTNDFNGAGVAQENPADILSANSSFWKSLKGCFTAPWKRLFRPLRNSATSVDGPRFRLLDEIYINDVEFEETLRELLELRKAPHVQEMSRSQRLDLLRQFVNKQGPVKRLYQSKHLEEFVQSIMKKGGVTELDILFTNRTKRIPLQFTSAVKVDAASTAWMSKLFHKKKRVQVTVPGFLIQLLQAVDKTPKKRGRIPEDAIPSFRNLVNKFLDPAELAVPSSESMPIDIQAWAKQNLFKRLNSEQKNQLFNILEEKTKEGIQKSEQQMVDN